MASHVLLAACRQEEVAFESRGGSFHGAFTVALVEALRSQSLGTLSYERLAELLILPNLEDRQHPQCEGINKSRVLFNASELIDRSRSFGATKRGADEKLVLNAGSIHGIVEGTEFVLDSMESANHELSRNITFIATGVQALQSFLTPTQPSAALLDGLHDFRVTVTSWNAPVMKVRLICPTGAHCSTVTSNDHGDISVYCGNGETLQIQRHDPLTMKYCHACPLEVDNRDLQRVLDGISRFNVHLYRRNPHTPIKRSFEVRLHQLQNQADSGLRPVLNPSGEDFFGEPAEDVICPEWSSCRVDSVKHAVITNMAPYYGLTLVNTSEFDLFPYVFYFDPNDCSVQVRRSMVFDSYQ